MYGAQNHVSFTCYCRVMNYLYLHRVMTLSDDECLYYHSRRNTVVVTFGTLSFFLTYLHIMSGLVCLPSFKPNVSIFDMFAKPENISAACLVEQILAVTRFICSRGICMAGAQSGFGVSRIYMCECHSFICVIG